MSHPIVPACVGYYVAPNMAPADHDGEPVIVNLAQARIGDDGVTRVPVTSHTCPDPRCAGVLMWDDGYQIHAGVDTTREIELTPGAACTCGYTINTTTEKP